MRRNLSERDNVVSESIGKRIGDHVYFHVSALTAHHRSLVEQASQVAELREDQFNVVKLYEQGDELSLLHYPKFFEDAFPTLTRSWRISLSRKTVAYRTYQESQNPPILHRKELLLPPDDARILQFAAITDAATTIGLFDEPNSIGFREQWYTLIKHRGYELVGDEFVPIANATACVIDDAIDSGDCIQRHRTALSRYNFSAPLQALSRHGLIGPQVSFFDYGCGRGDDVRGLLANGVDATGWDPHFAADSEKRMADVVNIGFVINVIEDMDERIEALRGAYAHTRGALAVAAMMTSQTAPEGRQFRDGYMTSRNTFEILYTRAAERLHRTYPRRDCHCSGSRRLLRLSRQRSRTAILIAPIRTSSAENTVSRVGSRYAAS
jgi:hypothetical protein